ncbi:methyltransferase, TIGR04325 family, partial [Fibrobacterota bacterium]
MKDTIKSLIPPLVLRYVPFGRSYTFSGNFGSWAEAKKRSRGYHSMEILDKVKRSALLVKQGKAAFERDSVAFPEAEYPLPVLVNLLWVASQNQGRLKVLDFGGSLASTYFQCRKYLQSLDELKWSVVEQRHYVECGKEHFETEHLKFHQSIKESINWQRPDVVLFGSVLQYLEKPFNLFPELFDSQIPCILVDRTPFIKGRQDRICVQKISARIYRASYPVRFFSSPKFIDFFSKKYRLWAEFGCDDKANIPS